MCLPFQKIVLVYARSLTDLGALSCALAMATANPARQVLTEEMTWTKLVATPVLSEAVDAVENFVGA